MEMQVFSLTRFYRLLDCCLSAFFFFFLSVIILKFPFLPKVDLSLLAQQDLAQVSLSFPICLHPGRDTTECPVGSRANLSCRRVSDLEVLTAPLLVVSRKLY